MNFLFNDRSFPFKTSILAFVLYFIFFYMLVIKPSISEDRSAFFLIQHNIVFLIFPVVLTLILSGLLSFVFLKPILIARVAKNVQYGINSIVIIVFSFTSVPIIYHEVSIMLFGSPHKQEKREYRSVIERMHAMPEENRAVIVVAGGQKRPPASDSSESKLIVNGTEIDKKAIRRVIEKMKASGTGSAVVVDAGKSPPISKDDELNFTAE